MAQLIPQPVVRIIEQPSPVKHRFRYKKECRSLGVIPGVRSTDETPTYPALVIQNYVGPVTMIVSCVTAESPHRPHPHSLVGRMGCSDGICKLKAEVTETSNVYHFKNLGIECTKYKREDIEEALSRRAILSVDPCNTGFDHARDWRSINIKAVRLAFQVIFHEPKGSPRKSSVKTAISDIVYDKKYLTNLHINHLSHCSGTVAGSTKIVLLCEKLNTTDAAVVFYQEDNTGHTVWMACANIVLVHKQVAIVFETPPYNPPFYNPLTHQGQILVNIQLRYNGHCSNAVNFEYFPDSQAPITHRIPKKRKTVMSCLLTDETENTSKIPTNTPQETRQSERLPMAETSQSFETASVTGLAPPESFDAISLHTNPFHEEAGPSRTQMNPFVLPPFSWISGSNNAANSGADAIGQQSTQPRSLSTTSTDGYHAQPSTSSQLSHQESNDNLTISNILNMGVEDGIQYDGSSLFVMEEYENLSDCLKQLCTEDLS